LEEIKMMKILKIDGVSIIVTRINNNNNGNPVYEISLFDDNNYNVTSRLGKLTKKGIFKLVSYNVEEDLKRMLK
jgi:hypothetical protein